jgi:hypothetical protein
MRYFRIAALLMPVLASGYASAADQPSSLIVSAPAEGDIACASPGVLASIRHRFAGAERRQWHRGFVMQSIDNPRGSGHPYAEPGQVKRDYCVADSVMTDGSAWPVYFTVEHGLGFVGIGRDIEFCVLGLDPWHVHDGDCRTVR